MSSVSFFMEISFFFYTFAIHLIINVKKETLNYKDLFQKVISLLSAPGKAWDEIEQRSEGRAVMTSFVYDWLVWLVRVCGKLYWKRFGSGTFSGCAYAVLCGCRSLVRWFLFGGLFAGETGRTLAGPF